MSIPPLKMDVVSEAERWLQATLSADAGVTAVFGENIYRYPGPRYNEDIQRVTYPLLTYRFMYPSPDTIVVGSARFWSTVRFCVNGTVEGNDDTVLGVGAQAIYNAIHGKFGYTEGAVISGCYEDRPYQDVELMSSKQYIHKGGEYVILINTV